MIKTAADYLTTTQRYSLGLACWAVSRSFPGYGLFLVGSVFTRPDYRDVDIRCIMPDEDFHRIFPGAGEKLAEPFHMLINMAISEWISARTGLKIDFQVQKQTEANALYKGPRNCMGMSWEAPDA